MSFDSSISPHITPPKQKDEPSRPSSHPVLVGPNFSRPHHFCPTPLSVELTPTTRCNIPLMKTQRMDLLGLPPNSPLVTQFLPHKALKETVFPRVAKSLRADTSLAPPRAVTQRVNQPLRRENLCIK